VASDVDRGLIVFDLGHAAVPGYYWDFPTIASGTPLVCRGVYYLKSFGGAPIEIEDVLSAELVQRGLDPSRYKRKRYSERGYVHGQPVAKGRVLLVGEASGIDPITGEGIAQAIQYGAAAGPYLAEKLARADFDFSDFSRTLSGASIGRDLRVRAMALPLAYGRYRRAVERYLLDTPEFLQVGLAHFAGRPFPKRAVSRAALRAAVATAKRLAGGDGLFSGASPGLRYSPCTCERSGQGSLCSSRSCLAAVPRRLRWSQRLSPRKSALRSRPRPSRP
jgi:flavin-dependent dehydrogenase